MDDWYSYLTEEFKLQKSSYRVYERAPFNCPKCTKSTVVRINHVKAKIVKLGGYECAKCRKQSGAAKSRLLRFKA